MAMKKPIQVHDRRSFLLQSAAGLVVAGAPAAQLAASSAREPLPVAAVVTVYRENSHADVLVGKILAGYDQQGGAGPVSVLRWLRDV